MNKKHLSVVMAGAMLATSVAPVLADTTKPEQTEFEVNGSNKGILTRDLRNFIEGSIFKNIKDNGAFAGKSVHYAKISNDVNIEKAVFEVAKSKTINEANLRDESCLTAKGKADFGKFKAKYGISPNSLTNANVKFSISDQKNPTSSKTGSVEVTVTAKKTAEYDTENMAILEKAIANATTGTKVEVYDRGHVVKDNEFYANALEDIVTPGKFTSVSLQNELTYWEANKASEPAVYKMELNKAKDVLTVYTRTLTGETEDTRVKYEYKVGDNHVNFEKAINAKGEALEKDFDENKDGTNDWITSKDIAGFAIHEGAATKVNKGDKIPEEKLYTITITDVDKVYNVKLSDLYDGLFLTSKGNELLDALKKYDADTKLNVTGKDHSKITTKVDENGLYSVELTFAKSIAGGKTVKSVVKVTTNDKASMDIFAAGISQKKDTNNIDWVRRFPVDVLAGSNRYATAVKVAKENADMKTVAENGNVVLVNGNALVDGLAAAPLAANVWNKDANGTKPNEAPKGNHAAPILLTDTNGIPKETRDYIRELIGFQQVMNLDKVTVYLVGGNAVISPAVENDLKELGLRVVRAGGEDREATSRKVAELMARDTQVNVGEAFVVGADGEADAMSVASVAAAKKAPIIVESRKGISEDTINFLKGYKKEDAKDVTIVGGETVVSEKTEKTLKDAKLDVQRIAGSNRQRTNAKVIDTYYAIGKDGSITKGNRFDNVLVSKDGQRNKSELIDALTATSLAVKHNAPIVLATNKLAKEQINALEVNADRAGVYVYQVGNGVARDVIKTIAQRVGLAK